MARSTLYGWLRRGRLYPDTPEGAFVAELDAADDEAERRCIELWHGHFAKDWRAIAEFMARRWPQRWGRQPSGEMTFPDGPGAAVSDEERAEALIEQVTRFKAEAEARTPHAGSI